MHLKGLLFSTLRPYQPWNSSSIGNEGSFHKAKSAEMYSLPLTSIFRQVQEYLQHNYIPLFVFLSWYLACYQT